MNIIKLTTLLYLHELISKKATGSPATLAQQLSISKRSTYRYLREIKNMGAPLVYCYLSESYLYETAWQPDLLSYLWQHRKM